MLTKKEIVIPGNPPVLTIIVGPCRVGTTALANIFAKAGVTTYMQPIKSARRALEAGEEVIPWIIEEEDFSVVKETIGSSTPSEFYDPLKILLELGYPKEKLQLIPIIRDPRKTLPSWRQMWEEVDLEKFTESYKLTMKIQEGAKSLGMEVIPYVHEVIRDQDPGIVTKKLFNKLKFNPSSSRDVIDWSKDVKFGEEDQKISRIKFYDVPPERFIKDVKEWGSYQFREEPELRLAANDEKFIEESQELVNIYEDFRRGCEKALGLKIKPYDTVDY